MSTNPHDLFEPKRNIADIADDIHNISTTGVNITNATLTGTFSPSGLKNGIVTTQMTITDVPTALPPTAYSLRNTVSVRVMGANKVYFGPSTVSPSNGYVKFQFEEISMDIQANPAVDLYAVCDPGQTSDVCIIEIG